MQKKTTLQNVGKLEFPVQIQLPKTEDIHHKLSK